MNTKTIVTAIIGAVVGLGLTFGTMAFAGHTSHMGNSQSTQTTNTHGSMHGKATYGGNTHALGQGMMGQTTPQKATQTGGMMGQTAPQTTPAGMGGMHQQAPVTTQTHHASYKQPVKNTLCHEDTVIKSDAKT